MRKVILRMKEQRKYEVIKKLVETNGNRKRAAVELDLSLRQINRLIAGYIAYGKEKIKKVDIKSKQLSLEFAHPT